MEDGKNGKNMTYERSHSSNFMLRKQKFYMLNVTEKILQFIIWVVYLYPFYQELFLI